MFYNLISFPVLHSRKLCLVFKLFDETIRTNVFKKVKKKHFEISVASNKTCLKLLMYAYFLTLLLFFIFNKITSKNISKKLTVIEVISFLLG